MRQIRSLKDAQVVLNDLQNWRDKLASNHQDLHGFRITNASPAVDDNDYVTKSQLPTFSQNIPVINQDFTVVFSIDGTPAVNDLFPDYIFGPDRVSYPTSVWLRAKTSPTGGALTVQVLRNGVSILVTDISITDSGPFFVSNFINPPPKFGVGTILGGKILAVHNAAIVSVGVCCRRILDGV